MFFIYTASILLSGVPIGRSPFEKLRFPGSPGIPNHPNIICRDFFIKEYYVFEISRKDKPFLSDKSLIYLILAIVSILSVPP